jgi:hypothetical protein
VDSRLLSDAGELSDKESVCQTSNKQHDAIQIAVLGLTLR